MFVPVPLPNAGPTRIGQDNSTNITQDLGLKEGHHKSEEMFACIFQTHKIVYMSKIKTNNELG